MTSNIGSHIIQEAFENVNEKNSGRGNRKSKSGSDELVEANHPT